MHMRLEINNKVWRDAEDSLGWPHVHCIPKSEIAKRDPATAFSGEAARGADAAAIHAAAAQVIAETWLSSRATHQPHWSLVAAIRCRSTRQMDIPQ